MKYLKVVELAVHLDDGHLVVVVRVGAVGELDAREGAGKLAAAGHPRDGGALVEEEGRVEELEALLLHHACAQDLALGVAGDELGGQHLDHNVRLAPLGGDEGVEVGLTGLGVVWFDRKHNTPGKRRRGGARSGRIAGKRQSCLELA